MTYRIEHDGVTVEAENERDAKRELRRLAKAAEVARAVAEKLRKAARLKAEAGAYRVLHFAAGRETFPPAWKLYRPGVHKWAEHLAKPAVGKRHTTFVQLDDGWTEIEHYAFHFVGAVCNGSGFAHAIVLQDRDDLARVVVYAVAAEGGQWALADCPGITPERFPAPRSNDDA